MLNNTTMQQISCQLFPQAGTLLQRVEDDVPYVCPALIRGTENHLNIRFMEDLSQQVQPSAGT